MNLILAIILWLMPTVLVAADYNLGLTNVTMTTLTNSNALMVSFTAGTTRAVPYISVYAQKVSGTTGHLKASLRTDVLGSPSCPTNPTVFSLASSAVTYTAGFVALPCIANCTPTIIAGFKYWIIVYDLEDADLNQYSVGLNDVPLPNYLSAAFNLCVKGTAVSGLGLIFAPFTVFGTPTASPTSSFSPSPTVTKTSTITASYTNSPVIVLPTATESWTPTWSPTPTVSLTHTPTPRSTPTFSKTFTPFLPTATLTMTLTATPRSSKTASKTSTLTETITITKTKTQTATETRTPMTSTSTVTKTETETVSVTVSPRASQTFTKTVTVSLTASSTITVSPTPTNTYTVSPTRTVTVSPCPTVSWTSTSTPRSTITFSQTFTASPTPTASPTASPTRTMSDTPTASPTVTLTATETPTFSESPTHSPTRTITKTQTQTFTMTPTATLTATWTPRNTLTFSQTFTVSQTNSPSPTRTDSRTVTYSHTLTKTKTFTVSPTMTPTVSQTFTVSNTFTVTKTITQTKTTTSTITVSSTLTPTRTITETATDTPGTGMSYGDYIDADGQVNSITITTSSAAKIYVGGSFTTFGGQPRKRLAVIDAATGVLDGFNAEIDSGSVSAIAVASGVVYVVGSFTSVNGGVSRNNAAAFDFATGAVTTWDPNLNGVAYGIDIYGSSIFVVGAFTTVNGGTTRNRAAAFAFGTGSVQTWNPNLNDVARTVLTYLGVIYVGGDFTTVNGGTSRSRAAAFDASSGTAYSSWLPEPNSSVYVLRRSSNNTILVGGSFSTIGGGARANIAEISPSSGLPTTWNPKAEGTVMAIAEAAGKVYFGGLFPTVGGGFYLFNQLAAALKSTGGILAWSPQPNGTQIGAIAEYAGNPIFAGGDFTVVGGAAKNGFVALVPATTQLATQNSTPSITPTATPTGTPTGTPTQTPTATPTGTPTATPTITPTATQTQLTLIYDASSATQVAAGTFFLLTHTVAATTNRLLVVQVALDSDTTSVTGVDFAGDSLTLRARATDAGGFATETWYMTAPATGNNNLSISFGASTNAVIAATSYYNADQAMPISRAASAFASSEFRLTITASALDALTSVLGFCFYPNTGALTYISGQEQVWAEPNATVFDAKGDTKTIGAAGTNVDFIYESNTNGTLGGQILEIRPAP